MRRGYIEMILSYVMLRTNCCPTCPLVFLAPIINMYLQSLTVVMFSLDRNNFFVMLVMFVMLYLMRTEYFILTKPQSGLQGHS